MLKEIADLGFEYAELSHGVRLSLIPGALDAVAAGVIKVSTLHNFCPLPMGVTKAAPNIFRFTSKDRRERDNALRHSLKTLETAERVGARLVVLHLGSIEMRDYTDKLLDLMAAGKGDSNKFQKLQEKAQIQRESKKEDHVERAYEILRALSEDAQKRGLLLGIENREALEEIPFESDFPFLFHDFKNTPVRYWHDCGHAQIKEHLGFIRHAMHLESMFEHLAGFHIHDVEFPGKDHRPPGEGVIDFQSLQPFVKAEHIKVFEMSPGLAADQVKAGVRHLKSLWGES